MAYVIKYEVAGKGSYLADFSKGLPRFGATLATTPRFATEKDASDAIQRMPLVAGACCDVEKVEG